MLTVTVCNAVTQDRPVDASSVPGGAAGQCFPETDARECEVGQNPRLSHARGSSRISVSLFGWIKISCTTTAEPSRRLSVE